MQNDCALRNPVVALNYRLESGGDDLVQKSTSKNSRPVVHYWEKRGKRFFDLDEFLQILGIKDPESIEAVIKSAGVVKLQKHAFGDRQVRLIEEKDAALIMKTKQAKLGLLFSSQQYDLSSGTDQWFFDLIPFSSFPPLEALSKLPVMSEARPSQEKLLINGKPATQEKVVIIFGKSKTAVNEFRTPDGKYWYDALEIALQAGFAGSLRDIHREISAILTSAKIPASWNLEGYRKARSLICEIDGITRIWHYARISPLADQDSKAKAKVEGRKTQKEKKPKPSKSAKKVQLQEPPEESLHRHIEIVESTPVGKLSCLKPINLQEPISVITVNGADWYPLRRICDLSENSSNYGHLAYVLSTKGKVEKASEFGFLGNELYVKESDLDWINERLASTHTKKTANPAFKPKNTKPLSKRDALVGESKLSSIRKVSGNEENPLRLQMPSRQELHIASSRESATKEPDWQLVYQNKNLAAPKSPPPETASSPSRQRTVKPLPDTGKFTSIEVAGKNVLVRTAYDNSGGKWFCTHDLIRGTNICPIAAQISFIKSALKGKFETKQFRQEFNNGFRNTLHVGWEGLDELIRKIEEKLRLQGKYTPPPRRKSLMRKRP